MRYIVQTETKNTLHQENTIILVVVLNSSSDDGMSLISKTEQYSHVRNVLVLLSTQLEKDIVLAQRFSKIAGVFEDMNKLLTVLGNVLKQIEYDEEMFSSFTALNHEQRALRDLTSEMGSFLWCTVVKGK